MGHWNSIPHAYDLCHTEKEKLGILLWRLFACVCVRVCVFAPAAVREGRSEQKSGRAKVKGILWRLTLAKQEGACAGGKSPYLTMLALLAVHDPKDVPTAVEHAAELQWSCSLDRLLCPKGGPCSRTLEMILLVTLEKRTRNNNKKYALLRTPRS